MTRKMIEIPGIQVLDRIPAPMLLLTTASLWGCSNVVQKTVLDDIGPLTALGLSSVIAAAALYPLARKELTSNAGQGHLPLKATLLQSFRSSWR